MNGRTPAWTNLLQRAAGILRPILVIASLASVTFVKEAGAYSLNGKTWASGSIVLQLGLGSSNVPLADGNTSWNSAVAPVLSMWNERVQRIQLSGVMNSTAPASSGDRVNSVVFAPDIFGQSFGSGTLGVAYYIMQGSNLIEADVLLNKAQKFDSYRGPLRFATTGTCIADIRRVFLHELGHAIGLNHVLGDAIMNAVISNRDVLAPDDIAGAQAMYGVPAPAPAPTSTPSPTSNPSRLANISTRMKVGLNDEVLIGGFIIKGSQPKKLIIRAMGPSLALNGIAGAMSDPVLELHGPTGRIAENDDWQTSLQAAEISASGVAPGQTHEAAVIATLAPGNYTALVRGRGNTQGIALVEVYELDAPSTRMVNLSTRGRIGVDEEVLIGGLIVQGATGKKVIVRALGPSLSGAVGNALSNPTLAMYNSAGQLVASNDDWALNNQKAEIIASTVAPSDSRESAVVATLAPGNYTAIVRGANNTQGVGLVEVYDLEP
ncbi:MAG: matrixin family metalloprotease [Chthoniobacterales bacterium]|nr:matrixin family metalloprotease [Chthoniobacterales bacterium]